MCVVCTCVCFISVCCDCVFVGGIFQCFKKDNRPKGKISRTCFPKHEIINPANHLLYHLPHTQNVHVMIASRKHNIKPPLPLRLIRKLTIFAA